MFWTVTSTSKLNDIRFDTGYRRSLVSMSRAAIIKWSLLLLVAVFNCVWMVSAGFELGPGYRQAFGWIVLLAVISLFYWYTGRDRRIMEFAHFGAQLLSLYALLMLLSYLAVSTDAPLADRAFDAIDKALGLDWIAWTEWVNAHPGVSWCLSIAYGSLSIQALIAYVYNVHTRSSWRNSEIWWVTFISALITIAGSAAFPASNPYVYYALSNGDTFLHYQHFLGLRDGTMHIIGFTDAQGLIQLPSFHTILAIMLTYNMRYNRWLFTIFFALNGVLILSCPTEGSHYFIDLIAGAVVAAATIWAVRRLRRQLGSAPIEAI